MKNKMRNYTETDRLNLLDSRGVDQLHGLVDLQKGAEYCEIKSIN